jgi:ddrB-like ParB superfamily domain
LPPPPAQSPDSTWGGMAANFGAGGMQALTGLAGAPVDMMTWLRRQQATAFGTWKPEEAIARGADPALFDGTTQVGGSHWLNQRLGDVGQLTGGVVGENPESVPANGPWERAARGAGAGTAAMVAPFAGARALGFTGDVAAARSVPQAAGEMLASGSPAGNAAIGAAGGGTGQVAEDLVPEPYKPLANAAGQLVGGVGGAGLLLGGERLLSPAFRAVGDYASPITAAGRDRLVGQKLANAATTVDAQTGERVPAGASGLTDTLSSLPNGGEIVPGSRPTTQQATADPGLGGLDRFARTTAPEKFNAVDAAQNAARVRAIQESAPASGNPANTQDLIGKQLADLNATHDASVNAAVNNANTLRDTMGGRLTDDQYGGVMRGSLADSKAAAKKAESALWQQIDPTNSLVIDPSPTTQAANQITAAMPKLAKPMSPDEGALFADASNLPSALPFSEFTAYRSRLLDAIREEKFTAGETPALRRMQQLRASVDNTIASAGQAADANAAPTGSLLRGAPEAPVRSLLQGSPLQGREASPGVGNQVFTPSGSSLPVRYEVVEGKSLVPSHTQDLTPNPDFPAELQPRERSRIASETQIGSMARNLQPERLGASADATTGAPIVGPDGVVESGNARALAIMRAYQQDGKSAQAYRDYLTKQGFDTEGLENPVLIRRRTSDLSPPDRQRFTQEANASPGLAMSATERAAQDAERLPASALDLYKGGDIASSENRPFVRAFMASVPEKNEMGALATADGGLSIEGAARVRNGLLAKAYGDSNLVGSLAETGDENIRAFGNALSNAAGGIAKLNTEIEAGLVPKSVDIAPALVEAARVVQRARASQTPIADLVAQSDAFTKLSPEALDVLHAAYGDDLRARLSQESFGNYLRFVTNEAAKNSTEAALFARETGLRDILAAGAQRYGRSSQASTAPAIESGSALHPGQSAGENGSPVGSVGTRSRGSEGPTGGGRRGAASRYDTSVLPAQEVAQPNFTKENAQAYRRAADATRNRAQTFGTGPVGQVLRGGKAGLAYNVAESSVPGKFFNAGSHAKEDVAAYVKAVGGKQTAIDTLHDYAAADLRSYAERDGVLKPQRVETWLRDHADALRSFPELAAKFKSAGAAQEAVGEAAAARKGALDDFQKSAAADWLGDDATDSVRRAFRSSRSVEKLSDMATRVMADPDAKAGFQRATADWIEREFVSNTEAADTGIGKLKSDTFQNFVKKNRPGLLRVFGDDRLQGLEAVVEDLRRANRSAGGTRQAGLGSNTAGDIALGAKHGSPKEGLSFGQFLGAELATKAAEHVGGAVIGHGILGGLTHGAGIAGVMVGNYFRRAGLQKMNDLVVEAMLDPNKAKALVMEIKTPAAKERAAVILNRALHRSAVPILLHNSSENGKQNDR